MKTKKVLALVVLVAFLISIVPFAAFAASLDVYNTAIVAPTGSVAAIAGTPDPNKDDGAEFEIVMVGLDESIFMASSRGNAQASPYTGADSFFYKKGDNWEAFLTPGEITASMGSVISPGSDSASIKIKVISKAAGTSHIVFANNPAIASNHALGREIAASPSPAGASLADVIGGKKYPVEFTSASVGRVELVLPSSKDSKFANGVDTYTIGAYVSTAATGGAPVAGKEVQFSILDGSGTLTASKATTNAAGKAEVKVYSSKEGKVYLQAKVGSEKSKENLTNWVYFKSPGIISIKAESDNNQKIARGISGDKEFKFSAYDANGNRVNVTQGDIDDDKFIRTVVTKPSGASLSNTDIAGFKLDFDANGYGVIKIDKTKLTKDGEYEIKVHLSNGVAVSYKFSAKEQGEITEMKLKYDASSYAAGSTVPQPTIEYLDAEGYAKDAGDSAFDTTIKISISDASFLTGSMAKGSFTLDKDKTGVLTMTAVDTSENLVATQTLNIEKAASYLKLTPRSVGAVGSEVTVKIELVDVDGKPVATNKESSESKAMIVSKPEGAIVSASISSEAKDFAKGKAEAKVSSNMEGDVVLRVIIVEKGVDGKAFTGACTVSFGKASTGAGQVIFIVGAPSYVVGNKVTAAESPSYIDNGRTFLGVRDMVTSIGATADWDQASQTATLSKDGIIVKVTVGASKIAVTKSGVTSEIEIDSAAQNKNGRVYLPFRAVMEAFNYTVTFDQATNSIVCTL